MKLFIWVAHPRQSSLCGALADRYLRGAEAAGHSISKMDLSAMTFDPAAMKGYGRAPAPLEPDLIAWQDRIREADHLLIVHPYWWGAMPAQAKAVLDRALAPGFGFQYKGAGLAWDGLLKGRTADVIITSDTPPLFDRLAYNKPGRRVLTNQVLRFCGVKVRRVRQFGSVKMAKPRKIETWLAAAEKLGGSIERR